MATGLQHELVTASAGFGKTHRLVSRLLALLTQPGEAAAAPDSIAALTFSRAAAGEILDTLVTRLARAAGDAAGAAREHAINSELPAELPCDAYRAALRRLLARMHTSFIGTIDSFFLRILQAFGPDLGVPGEVTILDDHDLARRRDELLRRLLSAEGTPTGARTELGQAFKHASYGQEAKTVTGTIHNLAEKWHHLFLRAPHPSRWGDPATIWRGASPWVDREPPAIDRIVNSLRSSLGEADLSEKQWAKWEELIGTAQSFTATTRTSLSGVTLFDKLLSVLADLAAGRAEITNYKKTELPPATCRAALALLHHIIHCELRNRLRATQGMHALLLRYESLYHNTLRRRGLLTFQDVPCLLSGRALQPLGQWDPAGPAPDMMYINYRLDGRLNHWALDEFQDTSRQQWSVLHDLVEEVLHASPPERSFFAVGDVKQAIYGWRGGDVRLMGELRDRYAGQGNAPLRMSQLPLSFRSSQSVLDVVNATFDSPEAWPDGVPAAARRRWEHEDIWCPHRAALDKPGFATVIQLARTDAGAGEVDANPCHAAATVILEELNSHERGLSVAVLVRSNREGAAITRHLRSRGIDARWDGDALIADNPVVAGILASLRAAAHPADTLASRHRAMTPLAAGREGLPGRIELLRIVEEQGFAEAVHRLAAPLRGYGLLDDFAQFRIQQLADAARRFDADGATDVLDFEDYVASFTVRDLPPDVGVRVMTLHRSKGLGFDAVILPDLDSARIDDVRMEGLSVAADPDDPDCIEWLLDLPPRAICEADDVLAEHRRHLIERNAFETLCLLYVGMTRAKQGLYAITREPGKSSSTLHMGTFLQAIHADGSACEPLELPGMPEHAVLAASGVRTWFEQTAPVTAKAREPAGGGNWGTAAPRSIPLHRRRLPSASLHQQPAAQLFTSQTARAASYGTLVHALFEEISWLDVDGLDAAVTRWRQGHGTSDDALLHRAEVAIRTCFQEAEIAEAFTAPSQGAELRREQPFELLIGGRWVSGVFDRVVHYHNAEGVDGWRAEILDFKSDRVETAAEIEAAVESHRPQMQMYRQALAAIARIPAAAIRVRLLFIVPRRLVPVE